MQGAGRSAASCDGHINRHSGGLPSWPSRHRRLTGPCSLLTGPCPPSLLLLAAEQGLNPADVYGGPAGAVAQLRALEAWFDVQRDYAFYSSSLLLIYEGDARGEKGAEGGEGDLFQGGVSFRVQFLGL